MNACKWSVLALLLAVLAILSACSPCEIAWQATDAESLAVFQWPENDFTAQIFPPQGGEIDSVYDYSASHRYVLSFRNLSIEDAAEYVAALKAAGFAEITSEANDASAGAMLQKGDTTLSIAYSQDTLIVLIALHG